MRFRGSRRSIRTYTEPGASRSNIGHHVTLGDLLAKIEGRVPDDHRRFLRCVLTEQLALNIRNRLLHGLSIDVAPQEAALVLQVVCLLATWQVPRRRTARRAPGRASDLRCRFVGQAGLEPATQGL
ncbi:MAG: hypothetical protein QOG01_359 [Pseudonocardiales bacterium]|nr:hypothetical protein [Pseudonocardiales bacterium]